MDVTAPDPSPNAPSASGDVLSPWRRSLPKLVVALAVGLAAYLLITAFTGAQIGTTASYPNGLESVTPLPGAVAVPGQSAISVDLAFDQEGVILINGREIPLDQMQPSEPATGVITFLPGSADGEDKDFTRLPGGVVNLETIFWPRIGSREADGQSYRWSITVN
jgi:hypothetical protein